MLSLPLGAMSKKQMVLLPLKCTCMPVLLNLIKPFTESSCIRYYNGNTFVAGPKSVDVVVLTIIDCLWTAYVMPVVEFDEHSVEGPVGKLHVSNVFLTRSCYCSVCVGFLYTAVVKMLLGPGETRVSRKGKVQSSLGSSMVI